MSRTDEQHERYQSRLGDGVRLYKWRRAMAFRRRQQEFEASAASRRPTPAATLRKLRDGGRIIDALRRTK